MVVIYNPRQGGFQSVAPSNPIEKAIDKIAPTPQLPNNNSNRSSNRNRSNQSRQPKDNLNQPPPPFSKAFASSLLTTNAP